MRLAIWTLNMLYNNVIPLKLCEACECSNPTTAIYFHFFLSKTFCWLVPSWKPSLNDADMTQNDGILLSMAALGEIGPL